MKVFPAIDILGGKVVRLFQGDYGKVTEYALSCADAARKFKESGARFLHAVDLDGAKSGNCDNARSVKEILSAADLFVEIGGGIRDEARILSYLEAGAGRVILGTIAVRNFAFVREMAEKYGEKIAVGVDAVDGKVAVSGWREVTDIDAVSFCERLAKAGVRSVIYTDVSRDGAMCGANLEIYRRLVGIGGLEITASGGVTTLEEIGELKEAGVSAVILGKALYEGALDLREVLRIAERP